MIDLPIDRYNLIQEEEERYEQIGEIEIRERAGLKTIDNES